MKHEQNSLFTLFCPLPLSTDSSLNLNPPFSFYQSPRQQRENLSNLSTRSHCSKPKQIRKIIIGRLQLQTRIINVRLIVRLKIGNHHGFSPVSFHPNQDFVLSRSLCKGEYAGGRWALFITLPAAICGESDQPDWLPRRFSPSVSAFERTNTETRHPLLSFHGKRENFLGKRWSIFRDGFNEKSRQMHRDKYSGSLLFQNCSNAFPSLDILLLAKFFVPFVARSERDFSILSMRAKHVPTRINWELCRQASKRNRDRREESFHNLLKLFLQHSST